MAAPEITFSHLRAPDLAPDAGPQQPGLLGQNAPSIPELNFSALRSSTGRTGGASVVSKTGQQKAQDIARAAGIQVSPGFGAGPIDRLAADFGKGLAISTPGRLIAAATGSSEAVDQLERLPTAQPVPWFADADTIGTLVGDTAIFSLIPPLAYPGKLVGRALGKVVGSKLAQLPIVSNALRKGAYNHVALSQQLTTDLIGTSATLFEAAGATTSAAIGFGGLTKLAGGDDQEAIIQGALAGVTAGLAPAFRGLKAAAVLKKVTSERYIEAEKLLADSLDNGIGSLIGLVGAGGNTGLQKELADRASVSLMAQLDPGLAETALQLLPHLQNPGGLSANIPQLRGLGKVWEDVATASRKPFIEHTFMKHGMTNAYRMGSGLGKSVDSTLRSMGPRGNQLANGVQKSMDDSDKVYAVITGKKDIALRGVTKAQHDAWVAAREAGQIAPGNINQTGIDALAHLYDNEIPDILRAAGITKLDGLTPGRYVSHHYNMDKMEAVVQKPEWLTLAQRQLGITYAKATELRDSLLEGARRSISSPITQVMRPSVDLHRTFNVSIAEAKSLGLPIADNAFALDRYARQIADRVGFAKNFGADSERMKIMLNDLRKTVPSKIHMDVIEKSLRAVVGLDAEPGAVTQAFSWVTNNVLVPQTLALASISQAGQSTNTIAKVGGRHFLRGVKELRRESRLFAGQGGQAPQFYGTIKSILDSIDGAAGDFFTGVERSNGLFLPKAVGREGLGSRLNLGGFILSRTGFNGLDKFNRFAAAYSGKSWLESNVRDAVRGTLSPKRLSRTAAEFKKLGLNMREIVSRGVLTDEELVHGAMRISDITQFRIRPFDLPLYWSSPNAGVFRMLKTFTFNQGRFIKREIISPATRYFATNGHEGSMRPFAFFIAGYPAAGAAIGSIRGILKGKEPFEDQTPMGAYFSAHAWVGGFGMLQDVFKAASNGTRAMLSMGAGPALTFGADMVEAGARSAISGDPNHLGRFVTRHSLPGLSQDVGGLRTYLDEALFPKD